MKYFLTLLIIGAFPIILFTNCSKDVSQSQNVKIIEETDPIIKVIEERDSIVIIDRKGGKE